MAPSSQKQYKIKLSSGRVLGPIGLDRIRILIIKGQIEGVEIAREHPVGEWADINSFPPIADLLVKKALGTLTNESATKPTRSSRPMSGPTVIVDQGATIPLSSASKATAQADPQARKPLPPKKDHSPSKNQQPQEAEEKTQLAITPGTVSQSIVSLTDDDEKTQVFEKPKLKLPTLKTLDGALLEQDEHSFERRLSDQETIMLERPPGKENWGLKDALKDPRKAKGALKNSVKAGGSKLIGILATVSVIILVYMLIEMGGESSQKAEGPWQPIRASLPVFDKSKKDPSRSSKYYTEAMKSYVLDTVPGYKRAAELLTFSVQYDDTNVKALAMLASCYLNLIDASNKDENYFSVISKLIELSRANQIELPETVIADVEFYITVNKAEAAQNRIVEYTKSQVHFDTVMFYYLALAFYQRGDAQSAARYIAEYPENKAFSPKLFYLRGQIAEKLGDTSTALQEYEKAIKMSPTHAKSRLAIAALLSKAGQLQNGGAHLEYFV